MKIPFADLHALHAEMRDELRAVFERVVDQSTYVLGPEVRKFEEEFAAYCETEHCVAVCNGTAALHLVLASFGVGPGDEVITVPNTFIATAEAISAVGARPVFVDVDPVSYNMDPQRMEAAITSRTRTIIPVHLYGQSANMDPILDIAERRGIPVIEDACQAHGATYKGHKVGSLGVAGCFSFYPGKNLGALGEGGAITTNDAVLAQSLRMWREHGSKRKYEHFFPGFNMRMNGLQGGFLSVKLRYLYRWNQARHQAAELYAKHLAGSDIFLPTELAYGTHVYHLYVIQCEQREQMRARLSADQIETGLHYPTPLHLQEAYHDLGYEHGSFPVTENAAAKILSLPMHPGITAEEIERVADSLLALAPA